MIRIQEEPHHAARTFIIRFLDLRRNGSFAGFQSDLGLARRLIDDRRQQLGDAGKSLAFRFEGVRDMTDRVIVQLEERFQSAFTGGTREDVVITALGVFPRPISVGEFAINLCPIRREYCQESGSICHVVHSS